MTCAWLLVLTAAAHGPTGPSLTSSSLGLPPLPSDTQDPIGPAAGRLGKQLFFDATLSADGKVNCGKCHLPNLAFTDGRARSVGHEGQRGTRNAPSLLNVVYLGSLFWDGRAADLESQALAPLANPIEHDLVSEEALVAVVRRNPAYVRDFAQTFNVAPDHISARLVARALSAYERTLLAGGSPFDRYLYGHDRGALTPAALRGLELFRGRAQCASCHTIGASSALLTDGQFHMTPLGLSPAVSTNLGSLAHEVVAAKAGPDRVALERLIATDSGVAALGRFVVTSNPTDIGKFKTPSLRNVALTAPYMHDGSVATLQKALELELYGRGTALSYPLALTVAEQHDLLEFLQSLTSPTISR